MTKEKRLEKYIQEHPNHPKEFYDLQREQLAKEKKAIREALKVKQALIEIEYKTQKECIKKERAKGMFEMYKNGNSLHEIGIAFGCTRARIQQILPLYFRDEYEEVKRQSAKIRHDNIIQSKLKVDLVCKNCKVIFHNLQHKNFCSSECYRESLTINTYPEWVNGRSLKKKNFTKDEWRKINTLRAKEYYQRNKERMLKKRKENYDTERQKLLSKRCFERKKYGHALTPLPNPKNLYALKP